jgi:hypothetical protein
MASVAGFHAVDRVLGRFEPGWLAPLIMAQPVSFFSYTVAHRRAMTLRGGASFTPRPPRA